MTISGPVMTSLLIERNEQSTTQSNEQQKKQNVCLLNVRVNFNFFFYIHDADSLYCYIQFNYAANEIKILLQTSI